MPVIVCLCFTPDCALLQMNCSLITFFILEGDVCSRWSAYHVFILLYVLANFVLNSNEVVVLALYNGLTSLL